MDIDVPVLDLVGTGVTTGCLGDVPLHVAARHHQEAYRHDPLHAPTISTVVMLRARFKSACAPFFALLKATREPGTGGLVLLVALMGAGGHAATIRCATPIVVRAVKKPFTIILTTIGVFSTRA